MELYNTTELWSKLKSATKPILLYGMGNGADKILSVLESTGVRPSGFFASDGFVRGHKFHGETVLSYSDACVKFGDFIVLIAFGSSLGDVMDNMKRIASERETYAPDVPVAGNDIFSAGFYLSHKDEIAAARELFADEYSRKVYDEMIQYKLDGMISHFYIDTPKSDALTDILGGGYTAYVDLGAYNGDTVSEAVRYFPKVKKITAVEPSPRIFKKLAQNAICDGVDVDLYNVAVSDVTTDGVFIDGAGRNSQIMGESSIQAHGGRAEEVKICAVDDICNYKNERLLIKLDVEGSERAAIEGARKLISDNECDLIVSAYHRSEDLFALPQMIKRLLPNHKLYLRKHPYIPAWDINIYVTLK